MEKVYDRRLAVYEDAITIASTIAWQNQQLADRITNYDIERLSARLQIYASARVRKLFEENLYDPHLTVVDSLTA